MKSNKVLTLVLVNLLVYAGYNAEALQDTPEACKQLGEFCGGIAGFVCCSDQNLICEFEDTFPDAGGTCVDAFACKELGKICGGFANIKCCDDLICKINSTILDASGTCVKSGVQSCKCLGEFCGGIAGFQCCENQNLICKLEGDFPDAGGKCVKKPKPCIS